MNSRKRKGDPLEKMPPKGEGGENPPTSGGKPARKRGRPSKQATMKNRKMEEFLGRTSQGGTDIKGNKENQDLEINNTIATAELDKSEEVSKGEGRVKTSIVGAEAKLKNTSTQTETGKEEETLRREGVEKMMREMEEKFKSELTRIEKSWTERLEEKEKEWSRREKDLQTEMERRLQAIENRCNEWKEAVEKEEQRGTDRKQDKTNKTNETSKIRTDNRQIDERERSKKANKTGNHPQEQGKVTTELEARKRAQKGENREEEKQVNSTNMRRVEKPKPLSEEEWQKEQGERERRQNQITVKGLRLDEQLEDRKEFASALGKILRGRIGMRHVINCYDTQEGTNLRFEDKEKRNTVWEKREEFRQLGIKIEKCRTLAENDVQDWLTQEQRVKDREGTRSKIEEGEIIIDGRRYKWDYRKGTLVKEQGPPEPKKVQEKRKQRTGDENRNCKDQKTVTDGTLAEDRRKEPKLAYTLTKWQEDERKRLDKAPFGEQQVDRDHEERETSHYKPGQKWTQVQAERTRAREEKDGAHRGNIWPFP